LGIAVGEELGRQTDYLRRRVWGNFGASRGRGRGSELGDTGQSCCVAMACCVAVEQRNTAAQGLCVAMAWRSEVDLGWRRR
jgi:hypothetical protein